MNRIEVVARRRRKSSLAKTSSVANQRKKSTNDRKRNLVNKEDSFINVLKSYYKSYSVMNNDEAIYFLCMICTMILFVNYYFTFNTGNTLFLADILDIWMTTIYLRQTLESGFHITRNDFNLLLSSNAIDFQTKLFKIFYTCISSYFFYSINTMIMRSILFMNPSYLVLNIFSISIVRFIILGIIPIYMSPNDIIYETVTQQKNKIPELVGNGAWAVTKIDSLKRTITLFKTTFMFNSIINFVILFPITIVGCQASSYLKSIELNIVANKGLIDFKRAQNDLFKLINGFGTTAAMCCCFCLNIRYCFTTIESPSLMAIFLDFVALFYIFLRYSSDLLKELKLV